MRSWWRRRTLHTRLSLLVTGAVAVAVIAVATLAWAAVGQVLQHQLTSQLTTAAHAIADDPDEWRGPDSPRDGAQGRRGGPHGVRELQSPWQLLGVDGVVAGGYGGALPLTEGARAVAAGQRASVQERVTLAGDSYEMLTLPLSGGGAVQVAVNQDPDDSTLATVGMLLVIGCAVVVAGAALLGRWVARAGLVPVQRLTQAVEDVAVTKDLSRPVEVSGVDEIARLGRSVNTMLATIDSARRAQRTLVEDAGHELRTPLTSLRTNIELLLAVERTPELSHRLPPEERAKLLEDLDAQVRELGTLTTELVELAREETTREDSETVEMADVVAAALHRVRIRAPGLVFVSYVEPMTVRGRPNELERMVLNVLDNAAKWSPVGGTVRLRLVADGPHECSLSVADDGPGIDEADQPHVFDRFYRAAAARALPGSGLGLAIVAQTAVRHGGTVRVEPRQPHGTLVTIRLPRDLHTPRTGTSQGTWSGVPDNRGVTPSSLPVAP